MITVSQVESNDLERFWYSYLDGLTWIHYIHMYKISRWPQYTTNINIIKKIT